MDANPSFFSRCFALSALLHASLATVGVTMLRIGDTDESVAPAVVEVSLVESVMDATAAESPPASEMQPPADAPARVESVPARPIDAPQPAAEPSVDASQPVDLGPGTTAMPRFDGDSASNGASDGIITLASSSSAGSDGAGEIATGASHADVRAWLEKHKRYPRAAAQRSIQGEATLELVLDASGGVVTSHILASSGHAVLDDEVLRMVNRAVPFPASARPSSGTSQYRIVIAFYLEEE